MENFITVTEKSSGKSLYLSVRHILGFFKVKENDIEYTKIKMADTSGGYWVVRESPLDILKMLNE